jgi:hypothetical protein
MTKSELEAVIINLLGVAEKNVTRLELTLTVDHLPLVTIHHITGNPFMDPEKVEHYEWLPAGLRRLNQP